LEEGLTSAAESASTPDQLDSSASQQFQGSETAATASSTENSREELFLNRINSVSDVNNGDNGVAEANNIDNGVADFNGNDSARGIEREGRAVSLPLDIGQIVVNFDYATMRLPGTGEEEITATSAVDVTTNSNDVAVEVSSRQQQLVDESGEDGRKDTEAMTTISEVLEPR
jgi:hypothetical protein